MSTMAGSFVCFQVCPEATSLENATDYNMYPDVCCAAAADAERRSFLLVSLTAALFETRLFGILKNLAV